jgi:hypothetical protein
MEENPKCEENKRSEWVREWRRVWRGKRRGRVMWWEWDEIGLDLCVPDSFLPITLLRKITFATYGY